jgi:hypothetical protein
VTESIGGLWLKDGKKGKFMSGQISLPDGKKLDIVVFKNDKGDNPKRPDYRIYPSEKRDEAPKTEPPHTGDFTDDVPF